MPSSVNPPGAICSARLLCASLMYLKLHVVSARCSPLAQVGCHHPLLGRRSSAEILVHERGSHRTAASPELSPFSFSSSFFLGREGGGVVLPVKSSFQPIDFLSTLYIPIYGERRQQQQQAHPLSHAAQSAEYSIRTESICFYGYWVVSVAGVAGHKHARLDRNLPMALSQPALDRDP